MEGLLLPITWDTLKFAAGMLVGFFAFLFLGSILLPGIQAQGQPLANGARRTYKLSGMTLFFATQAVIAVLTLVFDFSLTPVLSYFKPLLVVANVFSLVALALILLKGYVEERAIERHTKLPKLIHDIWFGNQLNPTFCGVDLKMFFYHPSLIGLGVIIAAFAYRQFELYGSLTPQMGLFLCFWWAYLFTHYLKEEFMLSTWDIIAEKFGFMLVWGDTVYVPFWYSICGWWLIDDTLPFHWQASLALGAFHILGHWIFRSANWQKDRYKRDRNAIIWGKPARTLGGRLLISGWWGIGRHVNYTGELMVYLSFALCTRFQSVWPYLLPFSLLLLLTQRAARDDGKCQAKYGELWEQYCKVARFRVIPFLY